ncbi:DUF483 domain-containing protein [Mesorhizobium sp. CA15]|uniref:DUF483 domain-containing protein n=1 Tax=Mesorhizobium sp. CA15 TaxID=2876641 RepID=UPI001CD0F11B|nr:DUF483 domain-containing protein [Mesorhizobium sp. CA15]MBZ9864236.1 DUF483 domain-containing protein [Mesorhizobium sp. CA15]
MLSDFQVAADLLRAAASCRSLRPAVLPEIAAFANAAKPSLRFVVSSSDAARLQAASTGLGMAVRTKRVFLAPKGNGWSQVVSTPTKRCRDLIVITRDNSAERLLDAELLDPIQAGLLLGYPECCVRAVSGIAAASDKWALHLLKDADRPINARLNRFAAEWGGIGLIGELFPCSLHCSVAVGYAESLYRSTVSLGLDRLAEAAKSDALASVDVSASGRISRAKTKGTVEFYW